MARAAQTRPFRWKCSSLRRITFFVLVRHYGIWQTLSAKIRQQRPGRILESHSSFILGGAIGWTSGVGRAGAPGSKRSRHADRDRPGGAPHPSKDGTVLFRPYAWRRHPARSRRRPALARRGRHGHQRLSLAHREGVPADSAARHAVTSLSQHWRMRLTFRTSPQVGRRRGSRKCLRRGGFRLRRPHDFRDRSWLS